MRYLIVLVVALGLTASELALAQNTAQEKAASLRAQLIEVETKQTELQTRLQKLEEDLKPENIAENLAGIGSTRPEDMREQRRRQLEIERNGVKAQFDLLATSRTRLETAIARADAEAYRQSALPAATPNITQTTAEVSKADSTSAVTAPARPRRVRRKRTRRAKRVAATPAVP